MELDTIWEDRGIREELKMNLVKALIWPVITYGAEGDNERRLEAAEMWCYRRMLRIRWKEKKDKQEHAASTSNKTQKMAVFGYECRNNRCNLVETCMTTPTKVR